MAIAKANEQGRESALVELAKFLAESIDRCCDDRLIPQLAKQYRECLKEIEEIQGREPVDDLGDLLE